MGLSYDRIVSDTVNSHTNGSQGTSHFYLLLADFNYFKYIKYRNNRSKISNGQRLSCPAVYWPRSSFEMQGSGTDRGLSSVEWGQILSVSLCTCLSIYLAGHDAWVAGLRASQLGLRASQLGLRASQLSLRASQLGLRAS